MFVNSSSVVGTSTSKLTRHWATGPPIWMCSFLWPPPSGKSHHHLMVLTHRIIMNIKLTTLNCREIDYFLIFTPNYNTLILVKKPRIDPIEKLIYPNFITLRKQITLVHCNEEENLTSNSLPSFLRKDLSSVNMLNACYWLWYSKNI